MVLVMRLKWTMKWCWRTMSSMTMTHFLLWTWRIPSAALTSSCFGITTCSKSRKVSGRTWRISMNQTWYRWICRWNSQTTVSYTHFLTVKGLNPPPPSPEQEEAPSSWLWLTAKSERMQSDCFQNTKPPHTDLILGDEDTHDHAHVDEE